MKNRILLLLFTGIFAVLSTSSQNLISSRKSSNRTYIYKISEKEALAVNKSGILKVDSTYFHTLIDTYNTDSIYRKTLPAGHYLKTFSLKNKQQVSYTFVPDFDVMVLNNNTDLCVQVYSLKGEIITNAKVSIKGFNLKYDKKTQCYIDRRSNKKGFLKVSHDGITGYFDLKRNQNNPMLARVTRKIIYGSPLAYVWMPINYIVRLPVDGVKSIYRGYPRGVIWQTNNFFGRLFDPNKNLDYKGYLVFNKPKYLPGDTVKFKAFLVDKKGKPLNKKIYLKLYNDNKYFSLAELNPYYPGGFEYSFYLHDSLNLKLDRDYQICLENRSRNNYISSWFKYEDYELSSIKLNLRTESTEQYAGKPFKIFARGSDENDLNLQDTRLELIIKTDKINKFHDDFVFVPDTLWKSKLNLKPSAETEILIPDSIFPKANLKYTIEARMLTSENKSYSKSQTVDFYTELKYFDFKLVNDSILVSYFENGTEKPTTARINATDNFDNTTEFGTHTIPHKLALNVYYADYEVSNKGATAYLFLEDETPFLQCYTRRTKDSVFISIDNPRKLRFTYNIYKRNTEVLRGSTDSLTIKRSTSTKQNYFISLRYLWGGKIKEETYLIPFQDKRLNVKISQPSLVYPGQKVKMEIDVTDQNGKAVEGVDLTAYSMTKKFDYNAPVLSYYGAPKRGKEIINNFKINEKEIEETSLPLNYEAWKTLAGLDSIEYYKFLYPGKEMYRYEYKTSDRITQFAPFVLSQKAAVLPIHVIYVDNKPVYFSWSTNNPPYSFNVSEGAHQIKLRLRDKTIVLNNMKFVYGHKTILSISEDIAENDVVIIKEPIKLSGFEKKLLNKYIFPYRNTFGDNFAYLDDDKTFQWLNASGYNNYRNFAGPVNGFVKAGILDGYSMEFNHEPNFEYDISPKILKMREVKDDNLPTNNYLSSMPVSEKLKDTVLTRKILEKQKADYLEIQLRNRANNFNFYKNTEKGYGKLQIELYENSQSSKQAPLNLVLLRHDTQNFVRVYNGEIRLLHQLESGIYKLIFFYPGSTYFVSEYIDVKASGTSFMKVKKPELLQKDSFSTVIKNLIQTCLYTQPFKNDYVNSSAMNQVHNNYMNQYPYDGVGDLVTGHIYDQSSKESIIGATINIKGTNLGTITNMDGQFSLKVPTGKNILRISYIGYNSKEINLDVISDLNIGLIEDSKSLQEVVVVGYGVQKSSNLSGAVSTIQPRDLYVTSIDDALQGRIAGLDVGAGSGFRIRGSASITEGAVPLYVVDGMVYTGDVNQLNALAFESVEVLKDAAATAIYGARGINGVIMITTKGNALKTALAKNNKGANFDQTFMDAASKANSLRKNFSDYAFWQPKLVTDKNGKAVFEVTFPDDVTNWQTYVLAMNGRKQSGQTNGSIKSYKPLMAQLAVPNFLLSTDTCKVIGKTVNYLPDSAKVTTTFQINKNTFQENSRFCTNALIDTFTLVAPTDSLKLRYTLKKEDGYFDGEERKIPVFPVGLEETKGSFYVLENEKAIQPIFDTTNGDVSLYAEVDYLDILNTEIVRLMDYKYFCNEQIASKLKAMLASRTIAKYKSTKFKYDGEIEKLIRLLLKNQKKTGLWGWWPNSEVHYGFSLHILEALNAARKQGFKVEIDETKIALIYIEELERARHSNIERDICILKMLKTFNCIADYKTYLNELDTVKRKTLKSELELIELKQLCGLQYNTELLKNVQQFTMFGNVFYRENDKNQSLMSNDIQNTLIAYRLLRQQNAADTLLPKIRRYFLETKQSYCWWNTYESAQILETILPDILGNKNKWEKSVLTISGTVNKTVTEFPYSLKLNPNDKITVSKTGFDPVYLTCYQHQWNTNPKPKADNFLIETHFENNSVELIAGKPVKLIVNLEVKRDAEYVMINIPIPGGCSYEDKNQSFNYNEYREYFKNETNIYCEKLRKGNYRYEISLNPRFNGTFTLNPAKVELMYFPTFNANNGMKTVKVK